MTDENPSYNFKLTQFKDTRHGTIKHKSKIYVQGDVHTNTVEPAFSLFKRGIIGSLSSALVKASASLLGRIRVQIQQSESSGLVWDDRAEIGIGRKFALCKTDRGECFHAIRETVGKNINSPIRGRIVYSAQS